MKTELEPQDIEKIAERVIELIKPLLPKNGKHDEETLFTPETLAVYLHVDVSWVYKQVSLKTIPYFKSGKYVRFKKSSINKWSQTTSVEPLTPFRLPKNQH